MPACMFFYCTFVHACETFPVNYNLSDCKRKRLCYMYAVSITVVQYVWCFFVCLPFPLYHFLFLSPPPLPLPPPAPLTDNVLSKVVSESEVRRVANAIDNCRVQNCTLNQPSSVHNVFVDGKIGIICTVFTTCIA